MKLKNTIKENRILICFNLFNEKKEFKYNCHTQIYGEIKEYYNLCTKLCNDLNKARKYNQAWLECYFFNNTGKTISKSSFQVIKKGITPDELQKLINNNKEQRL